MSHNPYAAPPLEEIASETLTGNELATRSSRFSAAFIDGLLLAAVIVPFQILIGVTAPAQPGTNQAMVSLFSSLVWVVAFLLFNGYTLHKRGQTLGKMAVGIQIVDVNTSQLLPFLRVYVYRNLWSLPLVVIAAVIPGLTDDIVLNLVIFIDLIMIFGDQRRCLHDYIAGSKVVRYSAQRHRDFMSEVAV